MAEKNPDQKNAGAAQKKAATSAEMSATQRSYDRSGNTAILNNEIEILFDKRLPYLDKGPVKAYEARAHERNVFFAMICEDHLIPQARGGPAYSTIVNSSLVRLTSAGPVFWPPENKFKYALVFENTLGKPLLGFPERDGLGWRPDHVLKAVVKPIVGVLADMRNVDAVHGCIRVSNMFDGGEKMPEKVILGEGLSTPPNYTQPVIYEPLERVMSDPIARGRGLYEDDLYAFGVALSVILRRKDPMEGMTDEEIIQEKTENGSYVALTGKDRYSGPILELLRGLLHDNPAERWTLDETLSWLEGAHISPRQNLKKKKAARPMQFNGGNYFRPQILAMALNKSQAEAVQMIDSGDMEQWITRSLEDKAVEARYAQAIEAANQQGRGTGYWDRLLSRVAIALDPEGPIRFKNLSMNPEGIGTALVEHYILKKDLHPFSEIINQQLVMYWVNAQTTMRGDIGSLISRFDNCRAFLRQPSIGYGMERCLYFLNPEAPCLSDRLKGHYIRSPEEFVFALEDISSDPGRPELFIDRHSAAFLSVKDRRVIDVFWNELNAPEYYKRIMGNIKVVATIQKRARMDMLPGLSNWVAGMLGPIYERYHDRELREALRKQVNGIKDSGDLSKIVAVFDNMEIQQKDFTAFRHAMIEYDELRKENADLETKLKNPEVFGKETGKEVAAIVSGFIAALFILALSFLFLMKKGYLK